jgi:hypothetical protein
MRYTLLTIPINWLLVFYIAVFLPAKYSIGGDTTLNNILQQSKQTALLVSKTNQKAEHLSEVINKKTKRYLKAVYKTEQKIKQSILRFDSGAINTVFSYDPMLQMQQITNRVLHVDSTLLGRVATGYYPYIDSLECLFKFLGKNSEGSFNFYKGSLKNLKEIESKIASADQLQQVLEQRKEQIKRYLMDKANLPKSIRNRYKQYSKNVFYYAEEIQQIKETFNEPEKLLKHTLAVANKIPAFTSFVKRNSFLSAFFGGTPGDLTTSTSTAVTGMVSRGQLLQAVNNINGSNNVLQSIVQQTASNQPGQIDINLPDQLRGSDNTEVIPNYEPNTERTKSFSKRLEFGTNIQTKRSTNYFPTTTDLALSIGYKLNAKSIIGLGASYKLGLGQNFNNIKLTSEGIGIRSFLDYKIKKTFFVTGGWEYNYQLPIVGINSIEFQNGWAASGLVGLTKEIKFNTKFFKRSKVQLLWDFLSKYQTPQRQQIVFRAGYTF